MWRKSSRARDSVPETMTQPLPLDGLPRRRRSNALVEPPEADIVSIVPRLEEPLVEPDVRRRAGGVAD